MLLVLDGAGAGHRGLALAMLGGFDDVEGGCVSFVDLFHSNSPFDFSSGGKVQAAFLLQYLLIIAHLA